LISATVEFTAGILVVTIGVLFLQERNIVIAKKRKNCLGIDLKLGSNQR
jgi:hypothetical protein